VAGVAVAVSTALVVEGEALPDWSSKRPRGATRAANLVTPLLNVSKIISLTGKNSKVLQRN